MPRLHLSEKFLIPGLLVLTLIIGGANLLATQRAVHRSQQQEQHALAVSLREEAHAIAVARRDAERAARNAIAASNHRWCHVVSLIDRSAAARRPATRTGRAFFADFRRLHSQFRC